MLPYNGLVTCEFERLFFPRSSFFFKFHFFRYLAGVKLIGSFRMQ